MDELNLFIEHYSKYIAVADPGFPVGGGVDLIGGVDSRGGYVLKILYVKMKELGPLGGGCMLGAPPRSANALYQPYEQGASLLTTCPMLTALNLATYSGGYILVAAAAHYVISAR